MSYDILFCASVYQSAASALRLAKSVRHIPGNHLLVLASPRKEDLDYLRANLSKFTCDAVLIHSKRDSMYFCRALGFVHAVHRGLSVRYYCSCDDDIEFTLASAPIPAILDCNDFSIMTFSNNAHPYRNLLPPSGGVRVVNPLWINGDSMFSHFEDNLEYGVADSPLYPMPYFVEVEYQHRLRYMSKKPILIDIASIYYYHHMNDNRQKVALRSVNATAKMAAGGNFFIEKYNILRALDFNNPGTHPKLHEIASAHPDRLKSHFIFDGLWHDWDAIYALASKYSTITGGNIPWD